MKTTNILLSEKQITDLKNGVMIDIKNNFGKTLEKIVIWKRQYHHKYQYITKETGE